MRRLIPLVLALSVLAAACGGGGDGDGSSTTTTVDTGDSTATTAPAATATTGPTTTERAADLAADGSDWCRGAADVQRRLDEIEARNLPLQERFRVQFEELLDDQLALLGNPPAAIAAESAMYAEALEEAARVLAEVEYNFFALEEGTTALFDDAEVQAASDTVTNYLDDTCELDTDGDESASLRLSDDEIDTLLGGEQRAEVLGSLLALGLSEGEAECVMRASLSQGVDVLGDADAELIALLEDCGVSADKLAAIGLQVDEGDVAARLQSITALFTPELQLAMQLSPDVRAGVVTLFIDQGLAEDQAECAVQTLTDLEDLEVLNDTDQLLELMFECGITLQDLAALG